MKDLRVSGAELAEFFRSEGCRLAATSLDFDITWMAHVEDAGPASLSWYRGFLPGGFKGSALVSRSDMNVDGKAKLVAYHDNPRMVLRSLITALGLRTREASRVAKHSSCRIHPSAVVGADGQSFDFIDGQWCSFPHAGGVRIDADVDIGPCATIMRGSVGDTVIRRGAKLGNGVNVGHDVRIGKNVLIIAGALIAGWVRIGDNAKIWQGAIIKNGVRIGSGAEVGMGSVVREDIPPRQVWAGNPARLIR